jgi:SAM-dependent methyltransferase
MSIWRNLLNKAADREKADPYAFACEVEREALKLIKNGGAPYNALDKARQLVAKRFMPQGEQVMMKDYTLVQKMLRNYDPAIIDRRISAKETMTGDNYFRVGASAVEVIVSACMSSQLTEVTTVLDLPCGHGRILRHLISLFPGAEFHACDLDKDGLEFCHATFGARPILSREDLGAVNFDAVYDLIWVGSLFTHTSYEVTKSGFKVLAGLLSSKGIVVATIHGRWATQLHRLTPYIDEDRWRSILEGFDLDGYGYSDYNKEDSHEFISGGYGISVVKPHVIVKMLETIPGIRIYMYQEKAWGDNHDIVVFGRPDWDESWW